ncbi:pentatricopeptide repeat-containing protein At1g11290, chloroplastic-like [Nymphaea colorata]|uniref:Pentatricopeptide repeat-containing protein n=1 Tax=Nymphaea colorata TaxID=210225 RepID=A0A5K1FMS2_9MAGN|nr:pentatricopeptide repeat-containing protein At1g11290, chloroplastic-like [Nymphaea colorata]
MFAASPARFIPSILPSHGEEAAGGLASALQTCIDRGMWLTGKAIHALAIKSMSKEDRYMSTKVVLFYAKFGFLSRARYLFDEMSDPGLVAWTILIGAYARSGRFLESLDLFRQMQRAGLRPNCYSLAIVLNLAVALEEVSYGKQIHAYAIRNVGEEDACLGSALVDFYARCGSLDEAREIFDKMARRDVVAWTIMINGYLKHNYGKEALRLFIEMCDSGVQPNQHTCTAVLKCASLDAGKQIHGIAVKQQRDLGMYVGSGLMDMYMKNWDPESARLLFDAVSEKDAVSFNTMISGYGRHGDGKKALAIFLDMVSFGLKPTASTYVAILSGCANLGSICLARQLHAHIFVNGRGDDAVINGAIIDMYAKCGSLSDARNVFAQAAEKSRVTWNSMINGYGKHGQGKEALELFHAMRKAQIKPDCVTFVCLLSACSHSGLIREGLELFKSMVQVYALEPENEHYSCMVDLLGRSGLVEQAHKFILETPLMAGPTVWGALLGACSVWGRTKIGGIAAQELFELESQSSGSYIALANILSSAGRFADSTTVRKMMDYRCIKKEPGCSWIEISGQAHKFTAGSKAHSSMEEILSMLRILHKHMEDLGKCSSWIQRKPF